MIPHTPTSAKRQHVRKSGKAKPLHCFIITASPSEHPLGNLDGYTFRFYTRDEAKKQRLYMGYQGYASSPLFTDKIDGDL